MRDPECLTCPVAVSLLAGIDIANAEHVGEQLGAAFAPSVTAGIAEIGPAVFCCISGSHQLVTAHRRAMNWLTNPGPEIEDCRRSNHVKANSGSPLSS